MFTNNTSYDGLNSLDFFKEALLGATSLKEDWVRVISGIKFKKKLPSWDIQNILQDGNLCTFTDQGDIDLNEKELEVCKIAVNKEICEDDLENTVISEIMRPGSNLNFDDVPGIAGEVFMSVMSERIANTVERIIWAGEKDVVVNDLDLCDGFVTVLLAAAAADVGAIAIDSTNVIAEMTKMYDLIDDNSFKLDDLAFYMPPKIFKAYTVAIASSTGANILHTFVGTKELDFLGIPIHCTHGLSQNGDTITSDTMVLTYKDNLWYGTDLMGDEEEVAILPQRATGSRTVRFVANWKMGVQVAFRNKAILYN